jgi:1-phosphofructokinase
MGARNVLITNETGAVLLVREHGQERRLRVTVPRVEAISTVGAGDALLAGFLAARRRDGLPEDALRQAVACGTASTLVPGAGVFDPREVKRQVAQTVLHELSLR